MDRQKQRCWNDGKNTHTPMSEELEEAVPEPIAKTFMPIHDEAI